uniref:Uncharacterized protein n=1 Tax=Glossina palpalis gambiensis TaxID=67801 RepID=A0A1B0B681_9MUSC
MYRENRDRYPPYREMSAFFFFLFDSLYTCMDDKPRRITVYFRFLIDCLDAPLCSRCVCIAFSSSSSSSSSSSVYNKQFIRVNLSGYCLDISDRNNNAASTIRYIFTKILMHITLGSISICSLYKLKLCEMRKVNRYKHFLITRHDVIGLQIT